MSQKEFQRVKMIENAAGGRLSVRRLSARSARHDHGPRLSPQPLPRSPLHLSAQRLPTGPSPNSSPANKLPLNWDRPCNSSASSRFPPTPLKRRAASSAPGAPARTAWSANFASPVPPPCRRPTPCSLAFASITTKASPISPPRPLPTSAACRAASIWPAASACATSGSWPPTTP